jgi:anthranilate/para-aminobenzoate synthase component I/branched-subunit amino acid aminotransferase/4-amino-4-deoxychorismate lyase
VPLRGPARPVRVALPGAVSAAEACLLVRGDSRPFTLSGAWAQGGALVGSEPLAVSGPDDDPFALLDRQPALASGTGAVVGGGWFGYLGYRLGARLEQVPAGPPRPAPLPDHALAFYDHLLRRAADGRWWFEALWTDARAEILQRRLDLLAERLRDGVGERPTWVGTLAPSPQAGSGHPAAVAACRERIAAGEIFQANICLRLDGRWSGDPLDLFARTARALDPRYGALVSGPWGAVCSASPELFLRRRGRRVLSEPIKGTAPRDGETTDLQQSAKDRAENVMIVDLMRNDLGRVCEYGSVEVPELTELRAAPGVWHLVSAVAGTLRPDVGDADLVRATFPPGSVTGAPKIRSMRVIAELEASGREAYTGAIGYASPVAGLELNVAIRTLELSEGRIWLGAGGGVVADSDPAGELEECLVKARPVVAAAGGELAAIERGPRRPAPPFAVADPAGRPDPGHGVLSTLLVRGGVPIDLAAHLARLARSVDRLWHERLPGDLESRVRAKAAAWPLARLRVLATPDVRIDVRPLADDDEPAPAVLHPWALPGGLGEHKWIDRRLVDELTGRTQAVPLFVDLDGEVLEAGYANVWVVEDDLLVTPPLDGRILPGTVRARLLAAPPAGFEAREEPLSVERLTRADEVFLSSSVRGVHPAALGAGEPRFEAGALLRAALLEQELEPAR